MNLNSLWQWERKKLPCRIRAESGNPGGDDLREQLAELAGVNLQDLLLDMKNEKKKREAAKGKGTHDFVADKNFKEVLTRQHIIGGAQIALNKISETQTNKSQRNVNKAFLCAPKSPPRRITMDTQRELARPLLIPNKDEKAAAAAKLERRLQKQRAARMAAKDESRTELEKKKIIEMAFNGASTRVLAKYDGDIFGSGGDYMEGMLYLSRVSSADGTKKKFVDMKRVLSEKAVKTKIQLSLSFNEEDQEKVAEVQKDAPDITSKIHCAVQLCNWSRNASSAQRLADEGAVRAIMMLCAEKVPRISAFCAVTFRFMSEQPVLANKMIDENALSSIVELIGSKTDEFICANLAIALLNLTRVNGREGQLVEDSIVLCFLNIISHRQDLHTTCVRGLYNLTCVDTNYPLIERVIRALISLSSSGIGSVKHICAAALCNLADLKGVRLRMIEEGVISVLSNLARGAETRTRRVCAVILQNLTASKPCRNEMVSRNCVQVCYGLSSDQDPIILRCIGLTLSRLALEASNGPRIINDGGIMALCNIAVKYPTIPGISQPVAVAFQLMSSRTESQIAIVQEGSVTAVASLLRLSQDVFTLQYGLLALCNLLSSPENHLSIVQQGLMSTLISLSVHTSSLLKDFCALAFFNLSCAEDSRKHIVNAGAIQAIINTCESESKLTKRRCAASLCNITTYESGIRRMVSDGIIPALSKLLISNDVETIRYTCAALCRLCSSLDTGKLIMDSGSMTHIIAYAISGDHINRQFCCAIISVLSYYEPCRIPLCNLGAIEAIKSLADLNDDDTKKRLLVAFANLSCTASLQQKMVDEGVVAIIAKLVDSYQELNQVCCARALCNLACSQPSRRRIVQEGGVAALMMVCMVRSVVLKTKELCLRALMNLLEDGTVSHLLEEGLVDAISSMAKLEDPAIVSLCAQLFNLVSTYEQGRVIVASRSSYLRSIFAMFGSNNAETRTIIARSCCNLVYSSDPQVLDKVVADGALEILGSGASLDDPEASMQAIEAVFLLSQQARFTSVLATSRIPKLVCFLMENVTSYDQDKAETCVKILANLTSPPETRMLLQNSEFLASFLRAVSCELNDKCIVWVAQIVRFLVFGYPEVQELIDSGLLTYIHKLCDVSHSTVISSITVVLRELCHDERCLRALSNSGIVSLLSRILANTTNSEVQYSAAVVLYELVKISDIRQRLAVSYQSDLVNLMIQFANTKNIEVTMHYLDLWILKSDSYAYSQCVEILAAVFYSLSYDFKSRPAIMTTQAVPLISLIVDQEPSYDAIGNVLVGMFALTKMPAARNILQDAKVDKLLQKLLSSQNSKTKMLSGNALKNLSSDVNETIEEGAVAALIAQSLEGKGLAGKSDDNFVPPVIAKADTKHASPPVSFDNVELSKFSASTVPFHLHNEATPGDFASRGPPAPEPPQLSSENSADFPSMIEDLDAGETEGRTKMSFAKMQVPSEVRNAYLFEEREYDIRKVGEEEEEEEEQEEKPMATEGDGDFAVLSLDTTGEPGSASGFESEEATALPRPNSRGSKLGSSGSSSKTNLLGQDRRKSRRSILVSSPTSANSPSGALPVPKLSQHSPKTKKDPAGGSSSTLVDLPQVSMEQKAAQLRLYSLCKAVHEPYAVMVRLSTDGSLELASVCVEYLSERCLRDRGLFKSQPSLVDVRKLQSRILESNCRRLAADGGALDGQLVAAALHLALNEMPEATMAFVYSDLMDCAEMGSDYQRCRGALVRLLCRLDLARFNFSRQLFSFLYRLGTTPGNDANLSQLVFIFTPLLCRLPNSTYMSVRHMEDLRRLRPVIQMVLEHHAELFKEASPGPTVTVTSSASRAANIVAKLDLQSPDKNAISSLPSGNKASDGTTNSSSSGGAAGGRAGPRKNLFIDLSDASGVAADGSDILAPVAYVSPPLSTGALIHSSGSGAINGESDVNDVEFAQLNPHMHRPVNFQSKEWEVLEDLVQCLAHSYLTSPQFYSSRNGVEDTKELEGDELFDAMDDFCSKPEGKGGLAWGSLTAPSVAPSGDPRATAPAGASVGTSSASSPQRRRASNARRRMVYECRSLRQQINKWESDFFLANNRKPNTSDRGSMTSTYNRYRDMKRDIRNSAATDIQRVVRGYLARRRGKTNTDRAKADDMRPVKATFSAPDGSSPRRKLHGHPGAASPLVSTTTPGASNKGDIMIEDLSLAPQPAVAEAKTAPSMTSGVSAGVKPLHAAPASSASVQDQLSPPGRQLYAKFKDLLLQKRTLKRKLKRFDEDFQARTGRLPKKADKEVMRPQYQKYHEIRSEMQVIRARIENELGYLPAELQEGPENDASEAGIGGSTSGDSDLSGGRVSTRVLAGSPEKQGLHQSSSAPKLVTYGSASIGGSSSHRDGKGSDDEDEVLMKFEQQTARGSGVTTTKYLPDGRPRTSGGVVASAAATSGGDASVTSTVPPRGEPLSSERLVASIVGSGATGSGGGGGSRPGMRPNGGSAPTEAWAAPGSAIRGTAGSSAGPAPIAPISGVLISKLSGGSPTKPTSGPPTAHSSTTTTAAATTTTTTTGIAALSSQPSVEDLQREKRQLHSILKAYERDFNQIHGRHVMRPEDIAPVATEYQRYKDLKRRLKENYNV